MDRVNSTFLLYSKLSYTVLTNRDIFCILGKLIYILFCKSRERLAVRKQAAQKFDGERFNLRKLNDQEVRKQYQIEITNRFAALENVRTRT
jgi:hypothetical protein